MEKKHFEENVQPIKYKRTHHCKSGKCQNPQSIFADGFDSGAKKQLETILEDYILIPRWKDGKEQQVE